MRRVCQDKGTTPSADGKWKIGTLPLRRGMQDGWFLKSLLPSPSPPPHLLSPSSSPTHLLHPYLVFNIRLFDAHSVGALPPSRLFRFSLWFYFGVLDASWRFRCRTIVNGEKKNLFMWDVCHSVRWLFNEVGTPRLLRTPSIPKWDGSEITRKS